MFGPKPNDPTVMDDPRPVQREYDSNTGNAGLDGYSVLSAADRKTGARPMVKAHRRPMNLRQIYED